MSVNTSQNRDTSTDNANWGTLVIVLMLVVVAFFVGLALYGDSRKPAPPITVTAPAAPVLPTAPATTNGTAPVSGTGQ